MDQSFIIPFIKATSNVFETMFQSAITVGKPEIRRDEPEYDVSGIIAFSGDVEGGVNLSFPMATAQRLVSLFTGMDMTDASHEDLCDAIGEIVNMIAGGAKAQFDGKQVSISTPTVVIGAAHSVYGKRDAVTVFIPCECDCGEFGVEIVLVGDAGNAVQAEATAAASGNA